MKPGAAMFALLLTVVPVAAAHSAAVLQVGAGREYASPGAAARIARDGDTVEIDAGVYSDDPVRWTQNRLTLRGVGGLAHMRGTGLIANGKAMWIIRGSDVLVENVEFSGARVRDGNGAGIRHEGGDLTLRNTFFHDNEFSVLSGKSHGASIAVYNSRFWDQRRNGRFSHGIYIGEIGSFTLVGSHFRGTAGGHQVKSRALQNHILYNRIEDGSQGDSSRLIDLPNCGLSYVIGNELQQGANTSNNNVIGYGPEGCPARSAEQRSLYVVQNTLVNQAGSAVFVNNHAGGQVIVANNLLFGRGRWLRGAGAARGNVQLGLAALEADGWTPPANSAAIDRALVVNDAQGRALVAEQHFVPPQGTAARLSLARPDVGARERHLP